LDVLSPFRPCGRDLVEFFNSTGWAFYVQAAVPMRLPDLAYRE
jgi:heme exporter protein D